jgi:hypothetical protein
VGKAINAHTLKRNYEAHPKETVTELVELLNTGDLKPHDFSIRDLFESCIENGRELLQALSYRKGGGMTLKELSVLEATGAVSSGDFANITGQIIYNKVREGYNYPGAIWPDLCDTMQTDFLDGERIPGIGEIGHQAIEVVGEGEEFPLLGLNEEYTDTVPLQKRGFRIALTREIIIKDRTGLLLQRAGNGGKWLGINKDIRVIDAAVGNTNNYNRNGVATNTYLTSGSYINQNNNLPLQNWQSIQALELLFAGITDPNTGAPIIIEAMTMLVPLALRRLADYLLQSGEVALVDNQTNPNTIRTFGDNPMRRGFWGQAPYKVISNSFVQQRIATNPTTAWFLGDFKRALLYKEAWSMETTEAAPNNYLQFERDIWQQWKVSECGAIQVYEPRFITRGN